MRPTRRVRLLAAPVPALSIIAAALLAGDARAESSSPRTLSLDQCVAVALRENPDAQSSEYAVRSAEAERAEVRGAFAPKVQFDGNVQQWTSPFAIAFGGTNFTVRDAFTWTAGVSLIQPITALLPIYQQYKIQELGVDVAAIRRAAMRREVAFHTIEAYYRLLESERLAAVASDSVAQLEAQLKQAQSQFDNGVIGKNDLLRAGLALAEPQRQRLDPDRRSRWSSRCGQLATIDGAALPTKATRARAVPRARPPPLPEPALEAAESPRGVQPPRAPAISPGWRSTRPRWRSRTRRRSSVPVVNAVGNYTHTEGSPFQQVNAAYVGLAASWDVWDWGTTLGQRSTWRDAKLHQAILARRSSRTRNCASEAQQAFVNAQSSRQALEVARTAVSQAEENFRIVTKKFENNAATSFDVVDAEALLTQSRGQVEQALYDYLIASAALQKATGAALPGES